MEAGLKKKELNEVVERCLQYYKRGKPPGGKNRKDFFCLLAMLTQRGEIISEIKKT